MMVTKFRIWRSEYPSGQALIKSLDDLDTKFKSYTHIKVKAQVLNITDDQRLRQIHEMNVGENDLIIIEL